MANRTVYFVLIAFISLFNYLTIVKGSFDEILEDVDACNNACDKTYPLHVQSKGNKAEACKRGCRFFSIGDFINDQGDLNVTKNACDSSCQEAYNRTDEEPACKLGCSTQFPISQNRRKQEAKEESTLHVLSPFVFVKRMYGNVAEHVNNMVSVSWSYYVQQDNDKMVVVQSGPKVTKYIQTDGNSLTDLKPPTDKQKSSGIHYVPSSSGYLFNQRHQGDDSLPTRLQLDEVMDVKDPAAQNNDLFTMDWLGCVSRKSGLPRWFLGLTIFLSSFAMIWLCFATTATAPEHRIHSQKVQYLTDLDYLRYYDPHEKVKIQPSGEEMPGPLPAKVNLEKI